ncbi:MAG: mechanosensitive ion channel family protein [Ilumatobacteraceae bacterium]
MTAISTIADLFPSQSTDASDGCAEDSVICDWVLDVTGNTDLATFADWFLDRPLKFIGVLLAVWILNKIVKRAVRRLVKHIVAPDRSAASSRLARLGIPGTSLLEDDEDDPIVEERRQARAMSISNVLSSTAGVVVWSIGLTTALGTIGIDLGPLIAGAGIAGVAIGFGAQSLVKDCIAGLFMLMEDQYGIGDVVDLGEAVGTVERITLRATVLRSLNGTVWHVPNGEVRRVGNLSQLWSVAVVDVDVAYDSDLNASRAALERAAREVCERQEFTDSVLEPPTVLGVESLGADGITIRVTVKVDPGDQWAIQRAIREHVKTVFDDLGIEIPFPQRTVWVRREGEQA